MGGVKIIKVFKGDNQISKIYKNNDLVFHYIPIENYFIAINNGTSFNWQYNGINNTVTTVVNKPILVLVKKPLTSCRQMFYGCSSLTSLDLSNLDTTNVTNMVSMFINCSSLISLDLSNFDTANVTSMASMFSACSSLTPLDVSNFDTSNIKNMSFMFSDCNSLTSLDVRNFDTSNVTDMTSMFNSCTNLTSLDVSNFDISKVISMSRMFNSCTNLRQIRCKQAFKEWCITNASTIYLPIAMQEGGSGTWDIID